MIKIIKGQTNSCIFTLNEKITLDTPGIILDLYSNANKTNKLLWLNDDVTYNANRYNQYDIVENDIEDLDNQIVSLPIGTYDYFVWQTDSATLSTDNALNVIESGLVKVVGTSSNDYTLDDTEISYTFE